MSYPALQKAVYILLFFFLLLVGLIYGKSFLVPLVFAGFFSMLLLPLVNRLEQKKWNRALAILTSELVLLGIFSAIMSLLMWELTDLAKDLPSIEKGLAQKINEVKDFVATRFGIARRKQEQLIQNQQEGGSSLAMLFSVFLGYLGSLLTNSLLCMIYIFLFLYYRVHLKNFLLKLVPPESRAKTMDTINQSKRLAFNYLLSMGLMILSLCVMYSIGFSIIGVQSPFFFAALCSLLEIVPFIGNLTGSLITLLVSLAHGGSISVLIGIVVTYSLVQFLQSYILEPLVVGNSVNINPLATIAGIVAGEFIWGVPGMILAIPTIGILKIICDHITPLKPYGYLLGGEAKTRKSVLSRVKQAAGKHGS
jgi:predicted PurR-regulated permease PerM